MTIDVAGRQTVGAAFLDRVAADPDRPALTMYRGSAAPEHPGLTYGELAARAGKRAAELAERLAPGERVVIALPSGPEFVELYLACLLAGLVAVPTPTLGGSPVAAERVAVIIGDCTPALVYAGAGDRDAITERLHAHGLGQVPVEEPGDPGAGDPGAARLHRPGLSADALAVLQYSSGSTGSPKGVMLGHGNVLANLAALRRFIGLGRPGDVFASWMPLHHDFSLFGQLSVALVHGAPVVLMPPTDFVRRPVEWLRMMARFGATVSSAPNFAFELCLRVVREADLDGLDLSTMDCLLNGSEPIHAPTMAAFAKRFARTGLRPEIYTTGYGMAETTVYVSAGRRERPMRFLVADARAAEAAGEPRLVRTSGGAGKEVVGCGIPGSHEFRIVDPVTRRALPNAGIGELWVRGDAVGQGYWGRPEASAETFQAELADEPGGSPGWLRTGDLGAVVDGELFITGRLKEMVIVRGRNLFPHDLEQDARLASPALAGFGGAAFGVAVPDERIVLIHEIDPKVKADELPDVATAVLQRLTASFGVPVRNVVLVRRGSVRRTTSGKIRRGAMRERFLAGQVPALYSRLDPDVRRLTAVDAP